VVPNQPGNSGVCLHEPLIVSPSLRVPIGFENIVAGCLDIRDFHPRGAGALVNAFVDFLWIKRPKIFCCRKNQELLAKIVRRVK